MGRAAGPRDNDLQTAINAPVGVLLRGFFDESNLINLTAEARVTLARRGSLFG